MSQNANGITPYKKVNKFVSSITHFYALRCQYYIYIPNITMCQIIYDRKYKNIIIEYERIN